MPELTDEQRGFVEAVLQGGSCNMLLGKAGVGKSVCIREVIERGMSLRKRFFVLAPTGVAALNVRGETVHRFLYRLRSDVELNFRDYPPDFILIDEVSMVRADLLDELDRALRRARGDKEKPFGGISVVLVGDCAQLPPVMKDEDREELLDVYPSPWFFSSEVFSEVRWRFHELTHIFRQSDSRFIDILNKVRIGEAADSVQWLNENRLTELARGTILVSTNKAAEEINSRQLRMLPGRRTSYDATVVGDFQAKDYPTEPVLQLCKDARIMVVKNIYEDKQLTLVNGDTGVVELCEEDSVTFKCDRTKQSHTVRADHGRWEKVKRVFVKGQALVDDNGQPVIGEDGNPAHADGFMEERVVGGFYQIPLRLAWAMTVHKSQGATLHEVTLDMRRRFFAEGQAYVALSRGSAIDRLWLYGRMEESDVKLSIEALDFLTRRMQSRFIFRDAQQGLFEVQGG